MAVKKLTETGIEKVRPPASGRLELYDAIVTGLCLRITPTGAKTWCFVYRLGKKQKRMTLGHYPAISLIKARLIAKDALHDIALGNDPIELKEEKIFQKMQKEEASITIKDLSVEFIERYAKPNNRTWKATDQFFRNHINPALGDKPAKDVRRKDVIQLIDVLKASGRPHAANHALIALRKMYNWAIERDEMEFNPCSGIKKPIATLERERVLTKSEIREFWQAAEKVDYPYGDVCRLLLLTGQRRSEISSLKWSDIDLKEKVIRISQENVKAKRGHDVPLSEFAISILNALPRFRGPYVFTTCHGKKPIDGFGKAKGWIEEHFKADDWCFHDLRRTCATGMAELGVPIHTISRILNHAEGGVTKIYARYSFINEKRKALNLWADHLRTVLEGDIDKQSNIVKMEKPA